MYPLVEVLTAVLFVVSAWRFGPTPGAVAAMAFAAALLALAVIDLRTMLLPDAITQPLLWGGIVFSLGDYGFTDLRSSVVGAVAGYVSLWLVANGYRVVRGKEGMGQGDFKLLAALGAWLGWQALPAVVLGESLMGVVVGLTLIVARRAHHDTPLPFGPYLAGAGLLVLFIPALSFY